MLQSSGMVAASPTNPLDEIPIGPQVFPYGTPSLTQSQVEPYRATNYGKVSTVTTEAYPSTVYQSNVQQVVEVPQVETVVVPSTIQTVTPVVQTSTQYQNVTRYKPVLKTSYVPRVVTNYVPMTVNSAVSPLVSTTGSVALNTSAYVQPSFIPSVPVASSGHFVSNVPVYENDPRRPILRY